MKDNLNYLICVLVLLISELYFSSTFKHESTNSKCNIIMNMIFSIYMYIALKVIDQLMTTVYVYMFNIIMRRNVYVLQFAYKCYLIIMFASTCITSEIIMVSTFNTDYNLYNIHEHSHDIIKGNVQGGGELLSRIHRWVYLLYRDYG